MYKIEHMGKYTIINHKNTDNIIYDHIDNYSPEYLQIKRDILIAHINTEDAYNSIKIKDKHPNRVIKALEVEKIYLNFKDVYYTFLGI